MCKEDDLKMALLYFSNQETNYTTGQNLNYRWWIYIMLKMEKPFLIAEAGINHGGNLSSAIKLVDQAKYCGVDAIKFQTYKTEKRVRRNSQIFNILKKCELSYEDFYEIKSYCDKKNTFFFNTI